MRFGRYANVDNIELLRKKRIFMIRLIGKLDLALALDYLRSLGILVELGLTIVNEL